jgi:hypothetical protein
MYVSKIDPSITFATAEELLAAQAKDLTNAALFDIEIKEETNENP